MRVLVVCADPGVPVFGPSGAAAHLRGVVRGLQHLGHEPIVAAFTSLDARGWAEPLDCEVYSLDPPRMRSWRRELQELLLSLRLRRRSELTWERLTPFSVTGGHPRILEVNAPLTDERPGIRLHALARWLQSRSVRTATRVVCVSRWLVNWARQLGGTDVRWVPNGTSCVVLHPKRPSPGLTLGFVGHLRPWHGLQRLPALLDALPEARLLVVGTGDAPVHPRIESSGPVPEERLPEVMSRFDVGLVPWADEAGWRCPLKLFDYRAQGIPVVASDRGDVRELLGSGGEVVPDDTEAWAAAIRRQSQRPRQPWVRSWSQVVQEALDGLSSPP